MKNNYSIAIETITPDRAAAFLSSFPRNRKKSPQRVESYADIMRRGEWAPFSVLIVDEDGNTVDGQHRLDAVVKSGVEVPMIVFRGLEKRFVPFIDTGRPRSAGDMLAFIEGMDDLGSLRDIATIARSILYYMGGDPNAVIPPDLLASFIIENKDSVKRAHGEYRRMKPLGARLAHAAAIFVIRDENPLNANSVDAFVEQITTGENIHSGMPTYAARNAIISSRTKRGGATWTAAFYTILRAWSAFVAGEQISLIKTSAATVENVFKINPKAER